MVGLFVSTTRPRAPEALGRALGEEVVQEQEVASQALASVAEGLHQRNDTHNPISNTSLVTDMVRDRITTPILDRKVNNKNSTPTQVATRIWSTSS